MGKRKSPVDRDEGEVVGEEEASLGGGDEDAGKEEGDANELDGGGRAEYSSKGS